MHKHVLTNKNSIVYYDYIVVYNFSCKFKLTIDMYRRFNLHNRCELCILILKISTASRWQQCIHWMEYLQSRWVFTVNCSGFGRKLTKSISGWTIDPIAFMVVRKNYFIPATPACVGFMLNYLIIRCLVLYMILLQRVEINLVDFKFTFLQVLVAYSINPMCS